MYYSKNYSNNNANSFNKFSRGIRYAITKLLPVTLLTISRSSRPEVFCKKGVLGNFTKSTGEHLCQSLLSFAKFLRTPFFTKHLLWLLLERNEIRRWLWWRSKYKSYFIKILIVLLFWFWSENLSKMHLFGSSIILYPSCLVKTYVNCYKMWGIWNYQKVQ